MPLNQQSSLERIMTIFTAQFLHSSKTELIGGAAEPLYLPATEQHSRHRLFFREDYLSSALHEIAHWCIAGPQRLQQLDFGYWYQPDGRTVAQQRKFEAVEIKPQALEWMFSTACGHRFHISVDNLNAAESGSVAASYSFKSALLEQVREWCYEGGLPSRAEQLITAVQAVFTGNRASDPVHYQLANLA